MSNKLFFLICALFICQKSFGNDCNYNLTTPVLNQFQVVQEINQLYNIQLSYNQNNLSPECIFYTFYFSKGISGSYERRAINSYGESINYNIYSKANRSGVLKDRVDASNRSEYIRGLLYKKNQQATKGLYLNIPFSQSNTMLRAGTYTDNIVLSVYSLGQSSRLGKLQLTQNIPVIINIPKSVSISLIESGGVFDPNSTFKNLNFGNLEEGKELSFDMRVASNAGYKVMFSSLNNGSLNLINGNHKVDYTLYVSNNRINLNNTASRPIEVATGSGVTGSNGALMPVKVRIGNVNENKSGEYEDYITITAQTNE